MLQLRRRELAKALPVLMALVKQHVALNQLMIIPPLLAAECLLETKLLLAVFMLLP
jgi:hypothetical protein